MGALTSKPYAFVARSWEVERVDCIDFFDVFGSSLIVELRGYDVVRVLPKINYLVNGEWLSDRARSFFDGLKYQRLLRPLIKIGLSFSYCSWFFVHKLFFFFKKLLNFFFNLRSLSFIFFSDFLAGEDEDLLRLVSFDFIRKILGNSISLLNTSIAGINDNFDFFDVFSNAIVEECDLVVLIGFEIRVDIPLLVVKLYELVNKFNLKIICFGVHLSLNCNYYNGGLTVQDFFNFLFGKHILSKLIYKAVKVAFFSGSSFLSEFSSCVFSYKTFFITLGKRIFNFSFYGVNGLASLNAGLIGFFSNFKDLHVEFLKSKAYDLEYFSNTNFIINNFFFLFNFDLLFLFLINNNAYNILRNRYDFIIYCGHNGDKNALLSDLLLPFNMIYERDNFYLSVFNIKELSHFVLNLNGLVTSKDVLLFFPVILSFFCGVHVSIDFLFLNYYIGFDLRFFDLKMLDLNFGFDKFNFYKDNILFLSFNLNFFQFDSLTKASRILALASSFKLITVGTYTRK